MRAGLMCDYLLYQRQGDVRISGDYLAKVSVSADDICLHLHGAPVYCEPARDPFKQVEHLLTTLPFSGWTAYGYVAFDLAKFYYPYSRVFKSPLLQFIVPKFEIRIAADTVSIHGVNLSTGDLREIVHLIAHPSRRGRSRAPTPPMLDYADRQSFCDKVSTLTQAIHNRVLEKAILSRCVRISGQMDLLETYATASVVDTAPRSCCFSLDNLGAVVFSPEVLLEADGHGLVITNPLAGTRPRGADPREDERLRGELFTDAKEVKEHVLSVLLAQEEIGSVCPRETLRIYDFMAISKFRCVQHLSSRVSGKLDPERTVWDALKAVFPAVTMSGVPKAKALSWINDLEVEPRGVYGGAVGWIDNWGRADLAIAIRSAFQYDRTVHLNAGAGIVAESLPEREYEESMNKMDTMLSQIVLRDA